MAVSVSTRTELVRECVAPSSLAPKRVSGKKHSAHLSAVVVVVALATLMVACDAATLTSDRPYSTGEGVPGVVSEPFEDFTPEGGMMVSSILERGAPIDRAAALAKIDTGAPVTIMVRSVGTSPGAWVPMNTVWTGGNRLQVMALTLPERPTRIQLGISQEDTQRIGYLRWSGSENRTPPYEARQPFLDEPLPGELDALQTIDRSSWLAQPARCTMQQFMNNGVKRRFTIHHSVTPTSDGSSGMVQALQLYETVGLGICDSSYHFFVGEDGTVFEGRQLHWQAEHAGPAAPDTNVAIGFLGCFDSERCGVLGGNIPSAASLDATASLLAVLADRYQVPLDPTTVVGFEPCPEGLSPACTGNRLYDQIPQLISVANTRITGTAPMNPDASVVVLPGMDAGPVIPTPTTDAGPGTGATNCGQAGCDWCASQNMCNAASCSWNGNVAGNACWSTIDLCTTATCWDTTYAVPNCGAGTKSEDFASGNYGMHRYSATVPGGEPFTLSLARTAGSDPLAMIITDASGRLIFGGDAASLHPMAMVSAASNGRNGNASVTITTQSSLPIRIYVSTWSIVDGNLTGRVPTAVRYTLSSNQMCNGMMPGPSTSESIGSPSNGSLRNSVPITEHPYYVIGNTGRGYIYGTVETVAAIRSGFDAVGAMHPNVARTQVRDLGARNGGDIPGHGSHESGRDVDITYILNSCNSTTGCPLTNATASTMDVAANWTLMESWLRAGQAFYIFVDHGLQRLLYAEAQRRGATSAQLTQWFQYPRATGVRTGVIRHVSNHVNHMHVRFNCPPDDSRCIQ